MSNTSSQSSVSIGTRDREIELLDLFESHEGEINQYFGRIGNGKTYIATYDVLKDLMNGRVVYVNWPINFEGLDQRESFLHVIRSIMFPWVSYFYVFPKENLRYIAVDENFHDNFANLTDCCIYLDEGHVVFDSYEMAKMDIAKRKSVLHTRHFNRTINIISQRFTAIHVTVRENVNRYYMIEKMLQFPFILFRKTEYQDLVNGNIDFDAPVSHDFYLGKKIIFNSYDTRYLRGDMKASQTVAYEAYHLTFREKLKALAVIFSRRYSRKK